MERKFSWIPLALMMIYYENPIICNSIPEELTSILPRNIICESYEVIIHHELNDTQLGYRGEVRMKVFYRDRANGIILRGAGFHLEIGDIAVYKETTESLKKNISVTELKYLGNNIWWISLSEYSMKDLKYIIKITFSKVFSTANIGYIFYQKRTWSENSASKFITFTHLNEIGGRYVFPCLDQLDMKAKFKMTLIYPKGLKGFTNAKSKTTGDDSEELNCIKEEFEETAPMAPFSIAIALLVSEDFAPTGFNSIFGVPVQTWAESSVIQEMYPLNDIFSSILKYFTTLFQLTHPLKKLDIIVLPDLSVPIEKSFGVIFMSEVYALGTVKEVIPSALLDRVIEICHAVSYQWIGHTVTMSDWKYNWWHEGLNYFLQSKCLNRVYPEFEHSHLELNLIESFLSFMRNEETDEEYEPISVVESFPNFRPMIYVTKEKVYHFIQMIHFILGPNLFHLSLAKYVEKYKFQNADLIQALDVFNELVREEGMNDSIPFKMHTIMMSWMNQKGIHPLIIVKRNSETKEVTVSRENFDLLKLDIEKHNETKCWPLPFPFITKSKNRSQNESTLKWLPCDEGASKEVSTGVSLKKEEWMLLNLELYVPGRVLYWHENWIAIRKTLLDQNEYQSISFLSRVRMISDMFALAEGGLLSYEIVFDSMMYLKHEKQYACWSVAMKEFDRIRSRLLGTSLFKTYEKFMRKFLEPVFVKQTFENLMEHSAQNHLNNLFELLIMTFSCKFGVEACNKKSIQLYTEAISASNNVNDIIMPSRSLYKVVRCESFRAISEQMMNDFWESYSTDEEVNSNGDLFETFGCSQNEAILRKLLERCIQSHPRISAMNGIRLLQSVASNEKGYVLMKEFYKTNFEKIPSFDSDSNISQISYLNVLLDFTNTEKDFNELMNFAELKKMKMDMWKEATSKNIRNAKRNIMWFKKRKSSLEHALYISPTVLHIQRRRDFISIYCEFVKKKCLFELISGSIGVFNVLLSILKQKFIIYEGKLFINICISDKTANGSETYILNAINQPTPHAQLDSVAKLCYAVSYQWIGYTVTMSDWTQNWWHHTLNHFLRAKCIREIHKEFEKSYLELTEIELFLNFLRSEETAVEYKPIQLLDTYPEFHPLAFVTEEKVMHMAIHLICFTNMGILLDATNREEDFTDLKNFAKKMEIDSWEEASQKNIRNAKKNYLWYNRSRESMKTIMDKYNKKYRRAEQGKHKSSRIIMDERKF